MFGFLVEGNVAENGDELLPPAGHSGHPVTLGYSSYDDPPGHPSGQLAGHFPPALNIGEQGWPPRVYPEDLDELITAILADGHDMAATRAALRRRGTPVPLEVERLRLDVEASAIAAGNAEIVRQGLEPTTANNATIDWHSVRMVEARRVVARIEALRRAGQEDAAVAMMRELPSPAEPTNDSQEEWAMIDRPFDYRMNERLAYGSYFESVTGYQMAAVEARRRIRLHEGR